MGWKNLPSWLKGGIFGVIFYLIVIFFLRYLRGIHTWSGAITILAWFSPVIILSNILPKSGFYGYIFFILAIFYFLLGALIGWLVGKFKKK